MKKEIYISTDIEADGKIPGPNSMLSFASAAFLLDGPSLATAAFVERGLSIKLVSTFSANLKTLPDSKPDPSTMKWWEENKDAYAATRVDTQEPVVAMLKYVEWIKSLNHTPVFVGYPAGFDFIFVYWYLINFTGDSPFSFSALDIKTYASAMLKCGYREATKRNFPKRWFSNHKHNHIALDDAIEQGYMFMNMLKENVNG